MGRRRSRRGRRRQAGGFINKIKQDIGGAIANKALHKGEKLLRKVISKKVKNRRAKAFLSGQISAARPFLKREVMKSLGQKGSGMNHKKFRRVGGFNL